jgi:hypothetical protein
VLELIGVLAVAICHTAAGVPADAASAELRLECPPVVMAGHYSGGWAVIAQDDAFLTLVSTWDEHIRGRRTGAASLFMSALVRPQDEPGTDVKASWRAAKELAFLFPGYLPHIAALRPQQSGSVDIVGQLYGGSTLLGWADVPASVVSGGPAPASSAADMSSAPPEGAGRWPGWKLIHGIRDRSTSHGFVHNDLAQPTLAARRGGALLAADAYGQQDRVVCAARLAEPHDHVIDGAVLGPGWAPALVAGGESVFCLAINKAPRRYDDFSGSLVAWKWADAVQWEAWAPGVPLDNVVRVDACNEGDTTLVACLTAAPEQRIHVYRLDPQKEGLTELLSVDPAPEGELGRDIAMRLLKGKAYLLWQDNVGDDPTYIVMRRLDLPDEVR